MEITDEQIRKLAVEAVEAGDQMMTSICEAALEGDGTARAICEIIIDDAIGMLP
jgi:predicted RNA-binding protein with TRAM domain